ncbi:hypothetical protein F4778DRAFT_123827 [Xylariomycetidae sp. FL2044]|nr:hypothetical protein F4778DRAFT_123827 [Xylariomycetidae sp. FL2044]
MRRPHDGYESRQHQLAGRGKLLFIIIVVIHLVLLNLRDFVVLVDGNLLLRSSFSLFGSRRASSPALRKQVSPIACCPVLYRVSFIQPPVSLKMENGKWGARCGTTACFHSLLKFLIIPLVLLRLSRTWAHRFGIGARYRQQMLPFKTPLDCSAQPRRPPHRSHELSPASWPPRRPPPASSSGRRSPSCRRGGPGVLLGPRGLVPREHQSCWWWW